MHLGPDVVVDLEQGLADVGRLPPPEHLLEKLRLSVYHQRLQATGRCRQAPYTIPLTASGISPRPTPRSARKKNFWSIS